MLALVAEAKRIQQAFENLSESAISLGEVAYSATQIKSGWIGEDPALPQAIRSCEARLGCTLPEDYRQLMLVCNGYALPNEIEPSFAPLERIERLKDADPDLIEAYNDEALAEVHEALLASILVGGIGEEQHFLLVAPTKTVPHWRYRKFANWIPGEEPYDSLLHYLDAVAQENRDRVKEQQAP